MLSRSRPLLRMVGADDPTGRGTDLDQGAEPDRGGEAHRWRIDGRPFALVVWSEDRIAGDPPPDARRFATAGVWVALRAL